MTAPTATAILPEAVLQGFRERAPGYDRENRFFQEDFDELHQAGYLAIAVPRELGGRGLTFAECMREQRRLGYYAHAVPWGFWGGRRLSLGGDVTVMGATGGAPAPPEGARVTYALRSFPQLCVWRRPW